MIEGFLVVSSVLLWGAVLALIVLAYALLSAVRGLREEFENSRAAPEGEGLMMGQIAPEFSLKATNGSTIDNSALSGNLNALLFISPLCPTCVATALEIEALGHKTSGNVFMMCEGSESECLTFEATLEGLYPFMVDESREVGRAFGILKTPTAVLVDSDGRIDKYGNPMRKEDIEKIAPEMFVSGVRPEMG